MNRGFVDIKIFLIFIIALFAQNIYGYKIVDYNDLYRADVLDISIQEPYNFFAGIGSIQPTCDIFDLSELLSSLIASMLHILDFNEYTIKVLLEDEKVAGFVIFKTALDQTNNVNFIGINGLAISEKYRKRGYGRALLNYVITSANSLPDIKYIYLTVNVNNLPARNLYDSAGFIEVAYRLVNNTESILCYKYL